MDLNLFKHLIVNLQQWQQRIFFYWPKSQVAQRTPFVSVTYKLSHSTIIIMKADKVWYYQQ